MLVICHEDAVDMSLRANKTNKKLLEIRQVRGIDEEVEVECTYQGEMAAIKRPITVGIIGTSQIVTEQDPSMLIARRRACSASLR